MVSIDKKIERGTKRIDQAIGKLKAISEFKVGDKLSVKEFNQKVQALNHQKKLHKYANMSEYD